MRSCLTNSDTFFDCMTPEMFTITIYSMTFLHTTNCTRLVTCHHA